MQGIARRAARTVKTIADMSPRVMEVAPVRFREIPTGAPGGGFRKIGSRTSVPDARGAEEKGRLREEEDDDERRGEPVRRPRPARLLLREAAQHRHHERRRADHRFVDARARAAGLVGVDGVVDGSGVGEAEAGSRDGGGGEGGVEGGSDADDDEAGGAGELPEEEGPG